MTATDPLEGVLAECVRASLNLYMYDNARFLCERLHACNPSEANKHLLATCYFCSQQPHAAYLVLKGTSSPECRYLLAQCCLKLDKLPEAETALLPHAAGPGGGKDQVPMGPAGYYLLGVVCKLSGRRSAAAEHFRTALAKDPFQWSSLVELCMLGEEVDPQRPTMQLVEECRRQSLASQPQQPHYPLASAGTNAANASMSTPYDRYTPERAPGGGTDVLAMTTGGKRTSMGTAGTPTPYFLGRAFGMRDLFGDAESAPGQRRTGGVVASEEPRGILLLSQLTPSQMSFRTPPPSAVMGSPHVMPPELPPRGAHLLRTPSAPAPMKGRAAAIESHAGHGLITPSPVPAATPDPDALDAPPRLIHHHPHHHLGGGHGHHPVAPSPSGHDTMQTRKFLDAGKLRKVSGKLFDDPRGGQPAHTGAASGGGATPADPYAGAMTPVMDASGHTSGAQRSQIPHRPGRQVAPGAHAPAGSGATTRQLRSSATPVQAQAETPISGGGVRGGGGEARALEEEMRGVGPEGGLMEGDGLGGGVMGDGERERGECQLLELLHTLGLGFNHLCKLRCKEALEVFSQLPQEHYTTGWVLSQVGRAHFEMVDYVRAEHAFEWARRVAPHQLDGVEIYSTVLWHLKKDIKLSYLAQEVIAMDRLCPQAWCVLGNCVSLHKEHETALKFFSRAIQLDSNFAYAHTLCGHEYFANEDFDNSLACYRDAIRIDPRHYNAWYGVGCIYLRQERAEMAEYHFRQALTLNPRSSVLQCYLGMALHALKRNAEALALQDRAIHSDSKNPLAKFEKARVLMSEERYEAALRELEELRELAPKESNVYYLMGQIYKKLQQPDRAMVQYSVALDLKPATADMTLIKTAIEKLYVADDDNDEDSVL
eukprot:jgi/Mesvir1/15361/Mv06563-RA.1